MSNATLASARGANEWDDIFESPWRFQRAVTQGTLTTHFFLNQSYTVLSIHLFSNTQITNLSVQSPAGIWQQETNCREFQLMVINKLGYKDQRQWMVWDRVLCVLFKNERLALKLYYYDLIPLGWDGETRKKGGSRLRKPHMQRPGGMENMVY